MEYDENFNSFEVMADQMEDKMFIAESLQGRIKDVASWSSSWISYRRKEVRFHPPQFEKVTLDKGYTSNKEHLHFRLLQFGP